MRTWTAHRWHTPNLRGALLQGAKLQGASLHHADFREADLRGVHNAVFDESNVVYAISGLAAKDPWSVLRRKYTGVMLLFHLVFLTAFLLPYAGRAAFWRAVNHGQVLYGTVTSELVSELRRIERDRILARDQWRARAQQELATLGVSGEAIRRVQSLLDEGMNAEVGGLQGVLSERISGKLESLGPCLQRDCVQTPVWRVLFQLDRGFLAAFLAGSLLLYNALRALLTWGVGLMRDEEERSGLTPPWRSIRLRGKLRPWLPWAVMKKLPHFLHRFLIRDTTFVQMGYRPLFRAHRVLTVIFWSIVSISIVYNGWDLLTTTVSLPAR